MADDHLTESELLPDPIALQPGAGIGDGRYVILGAVGYGGMGEVYKARDRQLDRIVAIKAVRPGKAHDPRVTRRLEREARLAASLDHPFICKIHELLQPDDGLTLLVMEFVDGQTLRAMLRQGPVSTARAVPMAREMAEALSVAHASGLVHRDLKPSNVMVTSHGHIKLMDFGVATIVSQPDATTVTPLTATGRVVGTPNYMSPEQAAGRTVDQRSDIFSFGVVMYECLTGRLPANASTPTSSQRAGNGWAPLPRAVPSDLRAFVTRCLEPDPADRFQTFEDIRTALDAPALARLTATSGGMLSDLRGWSVRSWFALAAVVLTLVIGVVAIDRWRSGGDETSSIQSQRPFVTWPTFEHGSRLSPDGAAVTFISRQRGLSRLWIRSVDGRDPVAISEPRDGVKTPAWSPDGRQIAYLVRVDNQASVQIVSVWGEAAAPPKPLGGAWDDVALVRWISTRVYFTLSAGNTPLVLWRYDTRDGSVHQVTDPSAGKTFSGSGGTVNIDVRSDEARTVFVDGSRAMWMADLDGRNAEQIEVKASVLITPRWRGTDGRRIVFVSNENGQSDVWQYDVESRRRTSLTTSPLEEESVDASAAGNILVADTVEQFAHLWAVKPGTTDAPRQLTNDSRSDVWPSLAARAGRLVFNRRRGSFAGFATIDTDVHSARWSDARLSDERMVGPGASGALSPDGQRVLFVRWPAENIRTPELWIQDLAGSRPPALLSNRFWFSGIDIATWSLVGQTVAWGPGGSGDVLLIRRPVEGSDAFELVRAAVDSELRETSAVLVSTKDREEAFMDLDTSIDHRALALVSSSRRPYRGGKLMWLDLENTKAAARTIFERPDGTQLYIAGWTRRGTVIAVAASRPDRAIGSDVFEVDRNGRARHVATAPGLLGITARVDAANDRLIATTLHESVATVLALALGDGKRTQLVSNEIDGITFGGYAPTADGWLLYMRKEINYNVWLFDFRPGSAGTTLQGGR